MSHFYPMSAAYYVLPPVIVPPSPMSMDSIILPTGFAMPASQSPIPTMGMQMPSNTGGDPFNQLIAILLLQQLLEDQKASETPAYPYPTKQPPPAYDNGYGYPAKPEKAPYTPEYKPAPPPKPQHYPPEYKKPVHHYQMPFKGVGAIMALGMLEKTVDPKPNMIAKGKVTINPNSPIAFDLNGDGQINTRSQAAGTRFDLDGNGSQENIAWVDGSKDGFLALDRNGNGQIDSGKELFGDQHGEANGFDELAKFDSNNDNRIDADDTVFQSLKVWQDVNGDGQSDASELKTLDELGITSVNLGYSENEAFVDENGVDHRQHGTIETIQGTRKAVDVWFQMPS